VLTVGQGSDGLWYAAGVVAQQGVLAPLGRRAFQVGPHAVGFDDSFAEPVVVRAYYDFDRDAEAQAQHQRHGYEFVGYIQYCQLTFRSEPILPSVFGGRLADRDPYVAAENGIFVDFMGPVDARLRLPPLATPFYPFNAVLTDGTLQSLPDFSRHPLANGSLLSAPTGSPTQSLCASLCAEVAPGLVTPAAIAPYLSADNLIVTIPAAAPDLANREAYRIALEFLKATPPEQGAAPLLQGLDESQVAAQVIGEYVLLTLPDPENVGATLCVRTRSATGGDQAIAVHLLSFYDMAGIEADVAGNALQAIRQAIDIHPDAMEPGDIRPRGWSGLAANPFTFAAEERPIELRYFTYAVGTRARPTRGSNPLDVLSGFGWVAQLGYDEDTRTLRLTTVEAPELIATNVGGPALAQYRAALANQRTLNATIDTSNFTKAAMRRDNFAGGTKLRFVDRMGADV
jgi:hypothetical protein